MEPEKPKKELSLEEKEANVRKLLKILALNEYKRQKQAILPGEPLKKTMSPHSQEEPGIMELLLSGANEEDIKTLLSKNVISIEQLKEVKVTLERRGAFIELMNGSIGQKVKDIVSKQIENEKAKQEEDKKPPEKKD